MARRRTARQTDEHTVKPRQPRSKTEQILTDSVCRAARQLGYKAG